MLQTGKKSERVTTDAATATNSAVANDDQKEAVSQERRAAARIKCECMDRAQQRERERVSKEAITRHHTTSRSLLLHLVARR